MTSPRISVFPTRYCRGWPTYADDDVCEWEVHAAEPIHTYSECSCGLVGDLGSALVHTFQTDAHFTACVRADLPIGAQARRLARGTLEAGVIVEIQCIVLDSDDPVVHGTPEPARPEWRREFSSRLALLAATHPAPFAYHTRGGARIVYALDEPMVLRSVADAQQWAQQYAIVVAHMSRAYGLTCDTSCDDWTRHYRLPVVTRDGELLTYETFGDPENIGVLSIEPSHVDIAVAKRSSRAFRGRWLADRPPAEPARTGLLYHLLAARGDILREHHADDALVVRCPHDPERCADPEQCHSCGYAGDSSTLLYPPRRGKELGWIFCRHSHCEHMTVGAWLRCFTDAEIAAARTAAGIQPALDIPALLAAAARRTK